MGDGRWVGRDVAAGAGGVSVGVGKRVAVEVTTGCELLHAPATTAITPETSNGNQSPLSRLHRGGPVSVNTLIC